MADSSRKRVAGKSLWDSFVDFVMAKLGTILPLLAGLVMGYLAAATKWLNQYGPISWGVAFLVGFVVFGVGWWIVARVQRLVLYNQFAKRREQTASINPLEDHFTRRRINLFDFFHPFYEHVKAAKFQDCELFGPSAIVLMGGTFLDGKFTDCEAVILKENVMVVGAIGFENCTFERCKFFRVTFFMGKNQYVSMKQSIQGTPLPIISDGTVGTL